MPEPEIPNLDDRAIIRPEGIACVQLGKTAVENGLPVGTDIKDVTAEAGAADSAAYDGNDAAFATAPASHFGDWAELDFEISYMAKLWVWQHGSVLCDGIGREMHRA